MYSNMVVPPKIIFFAFIALILSYFMYHIYHGDRGLIAQESLEKEYALLKETHQKLQEKRLKLENKINSLGVGDGQIDRDLLDEHAKKMGYIAPDEIMITD